MAKKKTAEKKKRTPKDPRDARMAAQLAHVHETLGKDAVRTLSAEYEPTACHSTGIPKLDRTLNGGIPKGRITELYGKEGGGKTTLALSIAAAAQKAGGIVHFTDAENKFDESVLEIAGVDRRYFQKSVPESSEEAWTELTTWLDNAGPEDIAIVDSLAALRSVHELAVEDAREVMGVRAKANSLGIHKCKNKVVTSGCTLLIINQVRYKMGMSMGNPETTPGGDELKFAAGTRLRIVASTKLDGKVGHMCNIYAVKSNHTKPYQRVDIPLIYGKGFELDDIVDLFESCIQKGIIKRKSDTSNLYFYGAQWEHKVNGRLNFLEILRDRAEVREWMQDAVSKQPGA